MKICTTCNQEKPFKDFPLRSRAPDGRQTKCRECNKAYQKQHYADNKKYYLKKAVKNRDGVKDFLRKAKERPCADCGIQYDYFAMDFDHLHDKEFLLAGSARRTGLQKVKREIAKCDVVCANCHRYRTHRRSLGKQD